MRHNRSEPCACKDGNMAEENRRIMEENGETYDYDLKIEEELKARRRVRKELAKHRRAIDRCNVLLLFETIVLAFLIIALIIIW